MATSVLQKTNLPMLLPNIRILKAVRIRLERHSWPEEGACFKPLLPRQSEPQMIADHDIACYNVSLFMFKWVGLNTIWRQKVMFALGYGQEHFGLHLFDQTAMGFFQSSLIALREQYLENIKGGR